MPTIAVLHRNRWFDLDGATARKISGNAWEIAVPATDPIHKRMRRDATPEAWDQTVFLVDDVETEPGIGTGTRKGAVLITALVLA